MSKESVTIRVPASTSNLGSGFDTLGLAVNLFNFIRVTRRQTPKVALEPPVVAKDPAALLDLLDQAAALFFRKTRQRRFGIDVSFRGQIPPGRGLGASATIRLGVVAGLSELAGAKLSRQGWLELATELEGHPDNVSPAIFGGFTVSGRVGTSVRCLSFRVQSKLKCVTLIPTFGVSTDAARTYLPSNYTRTDTVHALNRAALISAAFATGNYASLRGLFDDRVHQPYREKLMPHLSRVIRAGEKAGALGGFLSGSGSAVICLTLDQSQEIARAMKRALPESEVRILSPENNGIRIVRP